MILHLCINSVAERRLAIDKALRSGTLTEKDSAALMEDYAHPYQSHDGNVLSMGRGGAAEAEEANDSDNSIPFIISVYDEDRDGDVVASMGCRLGDERHGYVANPLVFFGL